MARQLSQEHVRRIIQRLQRGANSTINGIKPAAKSPDEKLGQLFADVQMGGVHADGKTFVDAVPNATQGKILRAYNRAKEKPGFNIHDFVREHFTDIVDASSYDGSKGKSPEQHINDLWPVLTREAKKDTASLISLPYPYVVPGGRFREQFYWDSYFIMIGLVASGRVDLVRGIMRNFKYMIRKFGFIPTGNRTYFLSRSQPPFLSHMVNLTATYSGDRVYVVYLPHLLAEYNFWMRGSLRLSRRYPAHRRVVRMEDGSILNRYWDDKHTPRPESYVEDVETAHLAGGNKEAIYRHIRAGAESGWDFSSRWLRDSKNLSTIHTTDIIPVDLNCLMYDLEMTISRCYAQLKQSVLASYYRRLAHKRASAIRHYLWDGKIGFYRDYDFTSQHYTPVTSLAGAFPLFSGAADKHEAEKVAHYLEKHFLKSGGFVTTLHDTGQQWDAPNGWAPLQWTTISGLRRYGYHDLAEKGSKAWIHKNIQTYHTTGKMVEKYNVIDDALGGGGEYPLQDGFGWTNGVLLALMQQSKHQPKVQ